MAMSFSFAEFATLAFGKQFPAMDFLAKLHQHRCSSTASPFEGAAMGSIVLNVYCNTDDAFLVWKANKIEGNGWRLRYQGGT
jgi:hypothetical protein